MSTNNVKIKIVIWLGAVSVAYFTLTALLYRKTYPPGYQDYFTLDIIHTWTLGEILTSISPALGLGMITLVWAVIYYLRNRSGETEKTLPKASRELIFLLGIVGFILFGIAAVFFFYLYPPGQEVQSTATKTRTSVYYLSTWGEILTRAGVFIVLGTISLGSAVISYFRNLNGFDE